MLDHIMVAAYLSDCIMSTWVHIVHLDYDLWQLPPHKCQELLGSLHIEILFPPQGTALL